MCAEPTLFEDYRAWRGSLGARVAPNTARTYRTFVFAAHERLLTSPLDLDGRALTRYLEAEYPPQAAVKVRQALADFYGWAVQTGRCEANPLNDAPRPRLPGGKPLKQGLEHAEVPRLLVAWEHLYGRRAALCALGQYYTGMRPGEWCRATTADVKWEPHPEVRIEDTKTGWDRIVPLSPRAVDVLRELCRDRVGAIVGLKVRSYSAQHQRAAFHAALEVKHQRRVYVLRHTFATHLIEAGVHIRVVAELLGHRDTRHTQRYTVPGNDPMRAAVRVLP